MPAQAGEDSPEGAAAFVKHYIELVNFAARTGDTSSMLSASADCNACTSFADAFAKPPVDGERFAGTLWAPTDYMVSSNREGLEVQTEMDVREGRKTQSHTFVFVLSKNPPYQVLAIRDGDEK